jgi:hypothetical protein
LQLPRAHPDAGVRTTRAAGKQRAPIALNTVARGTNPAVSNYGFAL